MHFSVWAPAAQTVVLESQNGNIAMRREESGRWSARVESPVPVEYGFLVDNNGPFPDPRSPWQPFGVHGPSRTVDHASFRWTDAGWQARPLSAGLIYELHVGTFTPEGTFDAVIERIPYLLELGVTHVELMPVVEFPGEWGWGYDGVDLYAPHRSYGGPDGLKRLVNALHANGLAAILDVVYNHLGPAGNYLRAFGPYFTERIQTPWGDAVNLNGEGSDEVRRFFIENAVMWLRDYHFDGLRLDAVHAFVDTSATHFLEELSVRVDELQAELGRHLILIAESDLNDPRVIRSRDLGGYGITAQWSDDFHHCLHTVLTGERGGYYSDFGSIAQLAKALEHGFVYDGCCSPFRSRRHGRPLDGIPKTRLLGYLQNHDQIGNRPRGERITALAGIGRVKAGAALVLTGPFIPMLFQGEEWGAGSPFQYFTNHPDPELGRAVSEGRRKEFAAAAWDPSTVPDPQDPQTFQRSKLNWAEIEEREHGEIGRWYRELIRLRRTLPQLRAEATRVQFSEPDQTLLVDRGGVLVACNFGRRRHTFHLPSEHQLLLRSEDEVECRPGRVSLPPDSVAVIADPSSGVEDRLGRTEELADVRA